MPGYEPGAYDRLFYRALLAAAILIIAIIAGYAVYRVAFNAVEREPEPAFDLSSLFIRGRQPAAQPQPDAGNPSMIVQEYLEQLRRKDYERAYRYLATPLRDMTMLSEFVGNARRNEALLRDAEAYRFSAFTVSDGTAQAMGHIDYDTGGRSRVEAMLVKEFGKWRIVRVTVVYE